MAERPCLDFLKGMHYKMLRFVYGSYDCRFLELCRRTLQWQGVRNLGRSSRGDRNIMARPCIRYLLISRHLARLPAAHL